MSTTFKGRALSASGDESEYRDDLKKLKELIRVGRIRPELRSTKPLSANELASTIGALYQSLEQKGIARASLPDRLEYLSLGAEYQFGFGRPAEAVENLAKLISTERVPKADNLSLLDYFDKWRKGGRRLGDWASMDPLFLRRIIWAFMAVAFYGKYHKEGKTDEAKKWLEAIVQLIDKELTRYYPGTGPYGSYARAYYFMAHCHRTAREFAKAEDCFLRAQQFADKRLERELSEANILNSEKSFEKREYEYQFAVACTARVLTSLGRVAMLQGHLHRALQLLYSARTLLRPSGQQMLQMVVESHIAITQRRLAKPGGRSWTKTLRVLERQYSEFLKDDRHGTRRIAQELAQSYLDEAEFLDPEERTPALQKADSWINILGDLATKQGERGRPERYRMHVLRARRALLSQPPNVESAENDFAEAEKMKESRHSNSFAVDNVELRIVEGMLTAAKAGQWTFAPEQRRNRPGTEVISFFSKLREQARTEHDRILEAEALLRLAMAEIQDGKEAAAFLHLEEWRQFGTQIQNATLESLHQAVLRELPQVKVYVLPSLNIKENQRLLKEQLFHYAMARTNTDAEAATMLGIHKSAMVDLKKEIQERPREENDV
jgi:tetratricopeptide (TPR) repeat protein